MSRRLTIVHDYILEKPKKDGRYKVCVGYNGRVAKMVDAEFSVSFGWYNIDIPSNTYDKIYWWTDPNSSNDTAYVDD